MKKLALSLLFSTAMIVNTLATPSSTTDLGPLQLITADGTNTFQPGGTVNLTGTINIGQSTNDIITITALGCDHPLSGLEFLMIDSSGQLSTSGNSTAPVTFGSLTAAADVGQTINFGISGGSNNYLGFTSDSGNITLAANTTGSNLNLSAANSITLSSSNITYPSSGVYLLSVNNNGVVSASDLGSTQVNFGTVTANTGNFTTANLTAADIGNLVAASISGQTVVLGNSLTNNGITLLSANFGSITPGKTTSLVINENGILSTANANTDVTFGNTLTGTLVAAQNLFESVTFGLKNNSDNYFYLENNSNSDVLLKANQSGSNLSLSANNHIILSSADLVPNGSSQLLMIDGTGNLITGNSTASLTCGSLTAGGNTGDTITLGIDNPSNNTIAFTTDSGSMTINAGSTGASLDLNANTNIVLTADALNLNLSGVTPTANLTGYVVLAVDRTGDLISSNSANIFTMGSDATGNNFIAVDNATTANGITLNTGALYLNDAALKPGAGYTNMLTIDSNGKIGIVVSSQVHKEEIQKINLDDSFDLLQPVSYKYKGQNTLEYGLIAEEVAKIKSVQNAVIYNANGTPMSVNYQHINMAHLEDYKQYKKGINEELNKKEAMIQDLLSKYNQLVDAIEYIKTQNTSK